MDGADARARWRGSVVLVAAVTVVGLAGSWVLGAAVGRQQAEHMAAVMDQRVEVVNTAVTAEVDRYIDMAGDLAVSIGGQSDLSAADFAGLTSTLSQQRFPGISGAVLVVPGSDGQVRQLQRDWRTRGNRQLTLKPVGTGVEHLFAVLNRSLDGTAGQTGRDLSQAVEPTQALLAARRTGHTTASATYVLLKDRQLPLAQRQLSFVLAAPVFGGIGASDAGAFRGWLLLGLRGRDFIAQALQLAAQDTVAVTLLDSSAPGAVAVPVARVSTAPVLDVARLQRQLDIPVAGRAWQLRVQPTTRFSAAIGPSLSIPAGSAGVLFTLLLALLVAALSTSRNRALTRVDSATAALRADIERRELVETALREREDELHAMALTDPLTGLANRRAFLDQLEQAHSRARRHDIHLAVLYADVDRFKAINDTYGHTAGDAVLCQVALRLRAHFRTEDTVGRLGGDEFAIICENFTPAPEDILDRLRSALATPYTFRDQLIDATVSLGLATPEEGESGIHLLERADNAMYLAKADHAG